MSNKLNEYRRTYGGVKRQRARGAGVFGVGQTEREVKQNDSADAPDEEYDDLPDLAELEPSDSETEYDTEDDTDESDSETG